MKTGRSRRIRSTAIVLTATALIATGCGRESAEPPPQESVTIDESPATGDIEFWAAGSDGDALPELLAQFEADNPDAHINVTQIPGDSFQSKLTTAIASGSVPDVVYLSSQYQPAMFSTGGIAPVPDGLVDYDEFFDPLVEAGQLDGVQYGVPWYAFSYAFMYRPDLADAAGTTPPTSWDEWQTFAAALQADGVEHPVAFAISWDRYTAQNLQVLATQNGGGFMNADHTEWTLDTSENVEALEFWASFFTEGYASPDEPLDIDEVSAFGADEVGGLWSGPWFRGWVDDAFGADWTGTHLAVTTTPAGPVSDQVAIGGGSLAVLTDAANSDAAWKLVRWMSSAEAQRDWYEIFGNLPANETAWDLLPDENGDFSVFRDGLSDGIMPPPAATWSEVGEIIGGQMERVVREGISPQEALSEAQAQADTLGTGLQ